MTRTRKMIPPQVFTGLIENPRFNFQAPEAPLPLKPNDTLTKEEAIEKLKTFPAITNDNFDEALEIILILLKHLGLQMNEFGTERIQAKSIITIDIFLKLVKTLDNEAELLAELEDKLPLLS